MTVFLIVSNIVLWIIVLLLGFLLLGVIRSVALAEWRLQEVEAITPTRINRRGLKVGSTSPDFSLPNIAGGITSLANCRGRSLFLVFVQGGCGPCSAVAPELNRIVSLPELRVIVVFNGGVETAREWADEVEATFEIVTQENYELSKRYEVYATPFAFLIDPGGIIRSKGIINNRQHIGFLLAEVPRLEIVAPASAVATAVRDDITKIRELNEQGVTNA